MNDDYDFHLVAASVLYINMVCNAIVQYDSIVLVSGYGFSSFFRSFEKFNGLLKCLKEFSKPWLRNTGRKIKANLQSESGYTIQHATEIIISMETVKINFDQSAWMSKHEFHK